MVFVVCVLHFLFYIQTGNTEETQSCKLHSTPFTELYMCARVCARALHSRGMAWHLTTWRLCEKQQVE